MKIALLTYAKDSLNVDSINRFREEAEQRGHTIERMRYSECSMAVENNISRMYYRGKEINSVDAVIPWIIQGDFNYGLSVLRHFETQGAFVLNTPEAILNASDKWYTAQLLSRYSIGTPDTYRTNDYKSMNQRIDGMSGDEAVIKINYGTRGKGVILSSDRVNSKAITNALSISSDDYIVQEFIKEASGVDIRAYVVGGEVIASMERRSTKDFRSNLFLGATGMAVTLSDEERKLAIQTAHALGLNCAGIDLIRSIHGPLVIEANASGGLGIEKITGANIAGKIIEYIEINVKRRNKRDKVGV